MTQAGFFQDILQSIFKRSIKLPSLNWLERGNREQSLEMLASLVLETKGEASALVYADRFLKRYEESGEEERGDFFRLLAEDYDLVAEEIIQAAEKYRDDPEPVNFRHLMKVAEPRRQELFRRLNSVSDGTVRLVRMREALLDQARSNPELKRVDEDFRHMFRSWFNRGFLVMRTVDWTTPAHILEKIIAYEAVHEIPSWEELRRRLEPEDRRCFAFFHPSMPDEPLIFVEVALLEEMPSRIVDVLDPERTAVDPEKAKTAIFYSISNCQKGLKGISFGNFLIKQVANDLQKHFPQLEEFATLSPLPGFMQWLKNKADSGNEPLSTELFEKLDQQGWHHDPDQLASLKPSLMGLCARYLFQSERIDGSPNDPVARFHLENGASLERVNWLGDVSERGLKQGAGLMINYRYDLSRLEQNHELYAASKEVLASPSVKALLREIPRSRQSLKFPVPEEYH